MKMKIKFEYIFFYDSFNLPINGSGVLGLAGC
jgi:hypothetical protein